MKLTLVAALFFCIWMHGFARNGTDNEVNIYGRNPTVANKSSAHRFMKLFGKEFERRNNLLKIFDNETTNETTSNASENDVVSFVDNSTQVEKIAYGTKKFIDLEHYFDGTNNVTMKNDTGIKKENFGAVPRQIQPLFLTQHQNPIGKKVKMENDIMYFLDDEEVNVTVKNNQLTFSVKDDHFKEGEKNLYFCFKSTKQNYISEICSPGFCEIRIAFLADANLRSTFIYFDNQTQLFPTNFITAIISENLMKVANVPNAPPPITTCNPDFSQGYWTVKVINKGDTTVHLQDVELFKPEQHEMETDMTLATIAGIAVGGFAILVLLVGAGALIVSVNAEKSSQKKIMKNDSQPKPDSQNKAQNVQPRKEQKIDVAQK